MKPTFLGQNNPIVTTMIQSDSVESAINTIRNAVFEGTDAFAFQVEKFPKELRCDENYKTIFKYMGNRPIYVTNYRDQLNTGTDDDTLANELISLSKYGATLFDIMGDLFSPTALQLTYNQEAIDKQKELINKIHSFGGEVLISSHTSCFLPAKKVIEMALEQQKRGADVVKIVTKASNVEEEMENLRITTLLKKELDVPFLFLSVGEHCKMHRMIGPMLGCAMYLCAQSHDNLSTKSQPVLRAVKNVLANFDYIPDKTFEN
ncbi:MAG: type I 3-dehydroquinate dehydratase [Ruminococcaceae bacterium]|nr:type I 3-dehydroquinate dehydratase [Oscillospiraceae bacterium]